MEWSKVLAIFAAALGAFAAFGLERSSAQPDATVTLMGGGFSKEFADRVHFWRVWGYRSLLGSFLLQVLSTSIS